MTRIHRNLRRSHTFWEFYNSESYIDILLGLRGGISILIITSQKTNKGVHIVIMLGDVVNSSTAHPACVSTSQWRHRTDLLTSYTAWCARGEKKQRWVSAVSSHSATWRAVYTHPRTHTHRYSSPTEKWHRTCSQRAYYGKPAEKLLRIDLQSLQQTLAYSFNRVIFEDLLQYKPMFAYNRECHKETYLWNLTWDKYHHKTHLPLSTHISLSKVS